MNEILKLIIAQNQKHLLSDYTIIPRELEIIPIARKSTVIMGIRRCGKTTWQYEKIQALLESNVSFENICFIDFSDDRLYFLRAEDSLPSIISDTYYGMYPHKHDEKVYFFFDEIQYVNLWGSFINRLQISENCEIYITGSSAKLLSKELSTEIASRTFSWELFPFSFVEFLRLKNISILFVDVKNRDEIKKGFDDYFYKGGMPERLILPNDTMVNKYFQNFVCDVITRDIILRYNISNPVQLERLTQILLNSFSRLITVNKLKQRLSGERLNLSPKLINEYIDKLIDSYLLYTVSIRSYNMAVQSINPKKVYIVDHALAQCMSVSTSENRGLILENIVFMHLRRKTEDIFYYKTKKGDEIDFVTGPDSKIKIIQVCWELNKSENTRKREIKALIDAMNELNVCESWVITAYEKEEVKDIKTGHVIHIVPAFQWLLE